MQLSQSFQHLLTTLKSLKKQLALLKAAKMHQADLYEQSNGLQKRDTVTVLKEFAPKLKWNTSELVLDIGCGSGDVTSDILVPSIPKGITRHHNVVGVDISNEMVNHATKIYGKKGMSFAFMDVGTEIPQRRLTRKFTKIFSFYCLHWVKDQAIALHNMHRLLMDDGEALLVFLAKNPLFDAYRKMATKEQWKTYMQDVEKFIPVHQDVTDPSLSFSMQCDTLGFHVVSCEARKMSYTFNNANQLVAALKAVNPFVGRIPQELQMSYMMDLMAELKNVKNASKFEDGKATAK